MPPGDEELQAFEISRLDGEFAGLQRQHEGLIRRRHPLASVRNQICTLQFLWTFAAVLLAAIDHSWGALGIAFVIGPIVNALIAVGGIVYTISKRATDPAIRCGGPVCSILLGAILSTGVIFASVMLMNLHGS